MTTLFLDTETFSAVPIKHGTHVYAAGAEVIITTWAIDDGEPQVVDGWADEIEPYIADPSTTIVIHNSHFDRTVLRHAEGLAIPPERIHCTMAQARAHGLPGGLGTLCDILGVPTDAAKDKAGKQLIHLFCKPRPKTSTITRATKATHPVEWERFRSYAKSDIAAMREVYRRLPNWNYKNGERALWLLDQKINDRGFAVDVELATAAIEAVDKDKRRINKRAADLTFGEVEAVTERDKLLAHLLESYGVSLPDMQKGTLERRLNDPDLPALARELIALRLEGSGTATAKYKALVQATSVDGRLRNTLEWNGASRTGRWSGRTFQPQNLPRPTLDAELIDEGIEAIKAGCADLVHDDVAKLASNAIRGCVVAPPGKKLVIADLANIEGRALAWLAGEAWKVQAFRDYDAGTGPDLYKLAYARSFGIRIDEVTKDNRQIGKVQELALGYQGAVGAFASMAALYGVNLPEDEVLRIVKAWRAANPAIKGFWYDLEGVVKDAIGRDGVTLTCRRLKVRRDGAWLRIGLPSGRALCYPSPGIEDGSITYMGTNTYTKKWERLTTYGGKLVENVTQAVARDVLAHNMPAIEAAGFEIVLTVHDEVLSEAPDVATFSADWLSDLLATNPPWAPDMPLAAEGFETKRYRKG